MKPGCRFRETILRSQVCESSLPINGCPAHCFSFSIRVVTGFHPGSIRVSVCVESAGARAHQVFGCTWRTCSPSGWMARVHVLTTCLDVHGAGAHQVFGCTWRGCTSSVRMYMARVHVLTKCLDGHGAELYMRRK